MLSGARSADEVTAAVHAAVRASVEEDGRPVPPGALDPEAGLVADLGLSSLDLARVVAILDLELGLDPFSRLVPITGVRTVGDLASAYLLAWQGGDAADEGAGEAERRARLRLERTGPAADAP